MSTSNSFTCPNGHSFSAIAKLRARCPECGAMARRAFGESKPKVSVKAKVEVKPKENPEPEPEPEPTIPKKEIKVVRQGKRQVPKVIAKVKPVPAIVTHRKVGNRKVVPIVRAKPKGNREHKVARMMDDEPSYMEQMIHKNWR